MILFTVSILPARGQVPPDEFQLSDNVVSLHYQILLSETNVAFFEFSGSQDIDDPLEDFSVYIMDPINWDLSESLERRTVYRAHTGFQTPQRTLSGTSVVRFGFETRVEHAHAYSIPNSGIGPSASEQHHNLVDVLYAPYLSLESQPISWIRMFGNLKLNILAFDVQHVCRTTCSLEPKGQGADMVPSAMGGLLLGPWFDTQIFINLGKGSYQFDEREPAGSTAEQQINRTRFLEFGFVMKPGSLIEVRGSLWGTRNNTDFAYNIEEEAFVNQGPSQRYGVNLKGKIGLPNQTTFTGGLSISRNTFRQSQQPIPHTPQIAGYAELHNAWTTNWSTTVGWHYIGRRSADNQSRSSFQTLDVLIQYQFQVNTDKEYLTASLGILNVGNHKSPFSLFHFDSGLTPDHSPTIDLNYSPGQPRTFVSGFSWVF